MIFRISKLFVFIVIVLCCLGCGKRPSDADATETARQDKIIVGFSQIGAESAWRIFNTKSIQKAAEMEGIQLIYSNAEQKQENQIRAIRQFIVSQVDVIVFVPIVQYGWTNVLTEAKDAKIPVIVCDRKLEIDDENLYAGYLGTDSFSEGVSAARFLQKKYDGQKGIFNIFELRGTDGSSASDDRIAGFRSVIDEDERFSIIYSQSGDFMRSCGEEIARNILDANDGNLSVNGKKIDIIFALNDGMALGFLDVLKRNGIKTGNCNGITVVTVDGQQEAIDRLKAGEINCVVECRADQGSQVMALAKKLVGGESIPRLSFVEEKVFTEYDDLSAIAPRGY